jgi:hypothetical protein
MWPLRAPLAMAKSAEWQEGKDDDRNRDLPGFADSQGGWDGICREQH